MGYPDCERVQFAWSAHPREGVESRKDVIDEAPATYKDLLPFVGQTRGKCYGLPTMVAPPSTACLRTTVMAERRGAHSPEERR